eukprot:7590076-Pyramimonas_sp.AAC.2
MGLTRSWRSRSAHQSIARMQRTSSGCTLGITSTTIRAASCRDMPLLSPGVAWQSSSCASKGRARDGSVVGVYLRFLRPIGLSWEYTRYYCARLVRRGNIPMITVSDWSAVGIYP